MHGRFGTIVQIGDVLVSEDVVSEFFACDYAVCRGECCLAGDSGAPLEEDEPEALERGFSSFAPLMSEQGREAALSEGFFSVYCASHSDSFAIGTTLSISVRWALPIHR